MELKKSAELFAFAHALVDAYPQSWAAWYAVGCYYYLIGEYYFISFMVYPAYSRGTQRKPGNLEVRHSIPHKLSNFWEIACWKRWRPCCVSVLKRENENTSLISNRTYTCLVYVSIHSQTLSTLHTGKSEFARRYLSKACGLEAGAGCVWLAYGHSFAADNEHDQAMAAYFKVLL